MKEEFMTMGGICLLIFLGVFLVYVVYVLINFMSMRRLKRETRNRMNGV